MSNIFYNIEPKVINTELACLIGLNEAIVLQQLHYWIEKNKATGTNFYDDRYWTYGTVQQYRDRDFRFWSFETVKRTLARLVSQGLVISGNYNKMKLDQTKWYAIDYATVDEMVCKNSFVADAPKPDNSPLGQIDPLHKSNTTQSNRAHCSAPLGQNDPMQQVSLPHSNSAHCPNPSEQVDLLQQVSLTHAIPENKKQINNKRLTNKTNTQNRAAPTAGVCASNPSTATVDVEIIEPAELLFDEFWKLYPRKESKQQAKKAWLKLNPDQALFNLIANALEYRSQTKEWLAEGGRYIPHPATWLNGRRWEDEIDPAKIDHFAVLEERYSEITLDGRPLDPVQRKQLEYIEKQIRERQKSGEVV